VTGTTTPSIYSRTGGRSGVLTNTSELLRPPFPFPARAEAGAFLTTGGLFSHLAVQKPRAGRIGRPFA